MTQPDLTFAGAVVVGVDGSPSSLAAVDLAVREAALRYAPAGEDLVVLADMTDRDRWWRTFIRPYPVHVLLHRRWRQGLGHAAIRGQAAWQEAAAIYTAGSRTSPCSRRTSS